jgi:hypothetical protein
MARTEVTGRQIKDSTVQRDDLDTSTVGQAVVRKIVQGSGITISSTGADSGTGDVEINATGGVIGTDFTASEALVAGDLVNIWDDSGTPKARLADASANKQADGFVLADVDSGDPATVYSQGINDQVSGLTGGIEQYLSASVPGGVTATAPTASGNLVQRVGKAFSATALDFKKGTVFKRG